MRFEDRKYDGGSYERPKPGNYIGVIVGFSYIGTHATDFGERPQVLIRWELHKRKGPSLDSDGRIHTATRQFGATINAKGFLSACLEAHGISREDMKDSAKWYGRGALLALVEKPNRDPSKPPYVNVDTFMPIDKDEDVVPKPTMEYDHWDSESEGLCPAWAGYQVRNSMDLSHRAPEWKPRDKGGSASAPDRYASISGAITPASRGGDESREDEDVPF